MSSIFKKFHYFMTSDFSETIKRKLLLKSSKTFLITHSQINHFGIRNVILSSPNQLKNDVKALVLVFFLNLNSFGLYHSFSLILYSILYFRRLLKPFNVGRNCIKNNSRIILRLLSVMIKLIYQ